jgi:integrase
VATDLRYMKLGRGPGSTWFFVYNIPKNLRGHPRFMTGRGKPMTKITESLETTDPEKARENRNRRIVYWDRQFRMMRGRVSDDDIREEAIEVYRVARKREAELSAPYEDWERENPISEEEFESALAERNKFYLRHLDEAIERFAAAEINDYNRRLGASLRPETDLYRKIGVEFLKAKIAAGDGAVRLPLPDGREIEAARDERIETPNQRILNKLNDKYGLTSVLPPLPKIEPPVPVEPKPITPPPLPNKTAETFSEAFERYLTTELHGTSADTNVDYRRKVKVFTDKIGDLPLSKITDHMAVAFLDDYLLGERKQKPMTRNTYAMLFSAIYKCAIRRKRATANPFEGQRVKQTTTHYEPFTDQELATLFADAKFEITPAKHKTGTALPWASLIAAFTGCRLEEVAQLKAEDIKQNDGVWYFEFCANGNGKTRAATRVAPLHHALIDVGLLRYRDALPKGSMLFPGLKGRARKGNRLGPNLGGAFNWWRTKLGVVRDGVNFHSFRHTVGDRLRKAGVPEDDRAALLGHEDERITSRVYGHDGPGLRRLKEIIEKLDYPDFQPAS